MKKMILIIAAMASIAAIGTQALACYWDGYWGGPMGSPMNGYNAGGDYQGFVDSTANLRQELAAKQDEYETLMVTSNPDPKRVAQLNRDITTLHDQLRSQARSHRLPAPSAKYVGYGHGRMGGYGGSCW